VSDLKMTSIEDDPRCDYYDPGLAAKLAARGMSEGDKQAERDRHRCWCPARWHVLSEVVQDVEVNGGPATMTTRTKVNACTAHVGRLIKYGDARGIAMVWPVGTEMPQTAIEREAKAREKVLVAKIESKDPDRWIADLDREARFHLDGKPVKLG